LQVGSKLDAIKRYSDFNLRIWAKGFVFKVDGELIHVVFENDS